VRVSNVNRSKCVSQIHFGLEYQIKHLKLIGTPLGPATWGTFEAGKPKVVNLNMLYKTYMMAIRDYSNEDPSDFTHKQDLLWEAL
jgi:hypothetical protein